MKRIIFNLKREWYDKIASGEKTVEYRLAAPYWGKRLCYKLSVFCGWFNPYAPKTSPQCFRPEDWFAVFRLGYSRKHHDIVRRIVKIDIGPCPYDGWDGEYFRIHFEPNSVRSSGLEGAAK